MTFSIRRCMVSDSRRIFELCRNELGYSFPETQIESNIRRLIGSAENLLLVAVDEDDEVVGFIHANNHDPVYAPPMKDIVAIAIYDEYRHIGLGRQLLQAVEEWAVQTGAHGVRVNSGIEQKSALRFYKSCGYDYIKTAYNFRKMFK